MNIKEYTFEVRTVYFGVSRIMSKSAVWDHFTKDSTGQSARCKLCKSVLKTVGGSTKGLHTHLLSNIVRRGDQEGINCSY